MGGARDRMAPIAELGLWVAGAALIAGAAGMRLPSGLLASSTPTPTAAAVLSGSSGASATPAPTSSPTPGSSAAPTLSPLVRKFQADLARKDFQFQATGTGSMSAVGASQSADFTLSGSMSYKAGEEADTTKTTSQGKTIADDSVYAGNYAYERSDGGPWLKKTRQASDNDADWQIFLSPARLFVDTGVEIKNGAALHRLEVADPAALGAEVDATGIVANAQLTLVFWVKADGTPADIRMEGTWDEPVNGVQAHVTTAEEFVLTRWSGVTIAAPKNPWQWIVDDLDGLAFGLPSNWSKSQTNNTLGLTSYLCATGQMDYQSSASTPMTLDTFADEVIAGLAAPAEGRKATTVSGVPAVTFGIHRSIQKDYESVTVLLRSGRSYEFLFFGLAGKDAATDAMAAQVLSTLEFTS